MLSNALHCRALAPTVTPIIAITQTHTHSSTPTPSNALHRTATVNSVSTVKALRAVPQGPAEADGLRGGRQGGQGEQFRGDLHDAEGESPPVAPGEGGGDEAEVCSQVCAG